MFGFIGFEYALWENLVHTFLIYVGIPLGKRFYKIDAVIFTYEYLKAMSLFPLLYLLLW